MRSSKAKFARFTANQYGSRLNRFERSLRSSTFHLSLSSFLCSRSTSSPNGERRNEEREHHECIIRQCLISSSTHVDPSSATHVYASPFEWLRVFLCICIRVCTCSRLFTQGIKFRKFLF